MKDKNVYKDEKLIEEFKSWTGEVLGEICNTCGVGSLNIHFNGAKTDENLPAGDTMFSIKYVKQYRTAYILFYPSTLKLFKEKKIQELMIGLSHEVCHIITGPLLAIAQQRYASHTNLSEINEEVTEQIAMIVRRLLLLDKPYLFEEMGNKVDKKSKKINSKIAKQQK